MKATTRSLRCTHTRVFCKDNKTTGDFFCFKKKADKRAYGARETLYQKWKGAAHRMRIKNGHIVHRRDSFRKAALHDKGGAQTAPVMRSEALACAMHRFLQREQIRKR